MILDKLPLEPLQNSIFLPKLSQKDIIYRNNLIKHKGNLTRAYQDTYNCSYEVAHSNCARKYKMMANDGKLEDLKALCSRKVNEFINIKTSDFSQIKDQANIAIQITKREVADKSQIEQSQDFTSQQLKDIEQIKRNKLKIEDFLKDN